MLRRLAVPALVVVSAALALAQPTAPGKQPSKKDKPAQPQPTQPPPATQPQLPLLNPPQQPPQPGRKDRKDPDAITLKVGDPAPPLFVTKWVKGEPVAAFERNKVYVIEFWATWCGPCCAQIPDLTSLQHRNRDLVVIGMSSSEVPERPYRKRGQQDDKDQKDQKDKKPTKDHKDKNARQPDEDVDTGDPCLNSLQDFVKDKGSQMDYRVAYDAPHLMKNLWLTPAGVNYIPCTFVIDGDGYIVWLGYIPRDRSGFESAVKDSLRAADKPKKKADAPDNDDQKKKDKRRK